MTKVSVVDISDASKLQEIIDGDGVHGNDNESDAGSDGSDLEEELGLVPRLFFSTFSMLTFLVPLVSTHIALDIIVHDQYAQDVDIVEIAARAVTAALGTYLPYIPLLHEKRTNQR
jgi:hypothetical protein